MKQNTKRAVDVWLDQYKDTHFIACRCVCVCVFVLFVFVCACVHV